MSLQKFKTNSHDEWLALRHQYVGGSDAAAIVGLNSYSSPYSVWAEKTNRVPGFEGNLATEVGTYLEDFVAHLFERETGKKVRRCNLSMVNSDYPFAIANVDRLIIGEDAGLEIKTTSELNLKKFKGQEYPTNYYVQSMHYMAVTGKKRWYLAVLIGNKEFRWFTIERDEEEIAALMSAEKNFWEHVVNDTPPAADGLKITSETLGMLYQDNGSSVDIAPVASYAQLYSRLKEQEKDLKKQINDAANHVKALMCNASVGTCGSLKVTWKEQIRRSLDQERLHADWPEIDLDCYMSESVIRVFKVKS